MATDKDSEARHKLRVQWLEVERRLDNGSIGAVEVRVALQDLIEKLYRIQYVPVRSRDEWEAYLTPLWYDAHVARAMCNMSAVNGGVVLQLHHFDRRITYADAIRELDARGLVLEDRLPVILTLLANYPDLAREFPIVTGLQLPPTESDPEVVVASSDLSLDKNRTLELDCIKVYSPYCRFLVRRK